MAIEIEHKYLVNAALWREVLPEKSERIQQGYLLTDPNKTIRVRIKGTKGFITIKGKSKGASRTEFEYEIPLSDAEQLLQQFATQVIDKTRHYITVENKLWEVDVFGGKNEGLLVAEIELQAEDEQYAVPTWVTENVTADQRYANSNLSIKPFTEW